MLLGGKKKSGHVHWSILQLKDHFANMGIHYNRFSIRSIKKREKKKKRKTNKQTNKQRRSTMESGESNDKKGKKKRKKKRGMR